jgi:hypothetical protein
VWAQINYADITGTAPVTAWSSLTGTLSNGQVIPYGDSGISRLGAASLAIGNGTAGDYSGTLRLSQIQAVAAGVTPYAASSGDIQAVRTATTGVLFLGNDAASYVFRNGNSLILQAPISGDIQGKVSGTTVLDIDATGLVSLLTGGAKISTTAASLTLQQTGDAYGTTGLSLVNRNGSNGAVFYGYKLPLVEECFQAGPPVTTVAWNGTNTITVVFPAMTIAFNAGTIVHFLNMTAKPLLNYTNAGTPSFTVTSATTTELVATVVGTSYSSASYTATGDTGTCFAQVNIRLETRSNYIFTTSNAAGELQIGDLANSAINASIGSEAFAICATMQFLNGTAANQTPDTGISRLGAASLAIGNGTAGDFSGSLSYNRVSKAGADFAGQATVTAGGTTKAVSFAANYTGTGQPVIVLTPTSDPLALGVPVGYWVTYSGGAGAWTGFTVNIQTALAGDVVFNYIVIGVA